MQPKSLINLLTYLGGVPFFVLGIYVACQFSYPIESLLAERLLLTYGAIIVAFLTGMQFGLVVLTPSAFSKLVLISSNLVALLAWLSLFLPSFMGSVLLLIFLFFVQLKLDMLLVTEGDWPKWFGRLRLFATLLVLLALCISVFRF